MLNLFRIWMAVISALLGVQIFLAGYGAIAVGAPAEAYELHIMNGRLIALLSLVSIPLAALARAGGKPVALASIAFGLVILQSVIALVSVDGTVVGQLIFGLHAVNGLLIMAVAGRAGGAAKRIRADRGAPQPAEA
ncbi:DUF6220 domain-containing protein [Glycomyces xiaoerkulensis]|uniref:DUF6220 domain-containing protein n=1 Tax=Glycomyces xiaoerkulensis TaxID=2038139 RepID=UPI000C25C57D|nr:DUF6220 domain-containing protein [Glycomyces xiaoerkulensis]